MEIDFIKNLVAKSISVDKYFHTLTQLGWRYDLEESDLFIALSKTFWKEGIKISLVLIEFCCVPPNNEVSSIESIDCYSFDSSEYPQRDIYSLYQSEEEDNEYSEWDSVDDYIEHFDRNYPYYIPYADFNTGLHNNDIDLLNPIDITAVPAAILSNIVNDLKQVQ